MKLNTLQLWSQILTVFILHRQEHPLPNFKSLNFWIRYQLHRSTSADLNQVTWFWDTIMNFEVNPDFRAEPRFQINSLIYCHSVYLACSFLINLIIVMVVLLVTPLMTIRGLLCISFTFCFIPVLIAAWFLKEQTNRLVPIVLCSFVAILMSLGASLR